MEFNGSSGWVVAGSQLVSHLRPDWFSRMKAYSKPIFDTRHLTSSGGQEGLNDVWRVKSAHGNFL
jgi:hypothetical protein